MYANGLQDKKNTTDWFQARSRPGGTSAGLRRIERRELDETFFCCCLLEYGLISLMFCSHGQAKKKMHKKSSAGRP